MYLYCILWHFIKVKSWDKVLAYSLRDCGFKTEQSHKPWEELNVGYHNIVACVCDRLVSRVRVNRIKIHTVTLLQWMTKTLWNLVLLVWCTSLETSSLLMHQNPGVTGISFMISVWVDTWLSFSCHKPCFHDIIVHNSVLKHLKCAFHLDTEAAT